MIVDKRKAVIENFKEEFSVFKAIETLEDLGYKVLKDIPLDLAESAITEAGKKVLTEAELEEIEKQAEAKVEEALKPETLVEKLEEAGYTVLSEEQLTEVEAKFEEKLVEKLESEGHLVIKEDEIEAFDAELAKIIEEKVKEALDSDGDEDGDEDADSEEEEEGDILDDEGEACKKESAEDTTPKAKPLYEKLLDDSFEMGVVESSEDPEIGDIADKAVDSDNDGVADKTDDETGEKSEAVKAGEKGSLLETLV